MLQDGWRRRIYPAKKGSRLGKVIRRAQQEILEDERSQEPAFARLEIEQAGESSWLSHQTVPIRLAAIFFND